MFNIRAAAAALFVILVQDSTTQKTHQTEAQRKTKPISPTHTVC